MTSIKEPCMLWQQDTYCPSPLSSARITALQPRERDRETFYVSQRITTSSPVVFSGPLIRVDMPQYLVYLPSST